MKTLLVTALVLMSSAAGAQQYLGRLSSNPYASDSTSNPYGRYGSPYSNDSINNPYGKYGSPYSDYSPNNPYANHAPRIYGNGSLYGEE